MWKLQSSVKRLLSLFFCRRRPGPGLLWSFSSSTTSSRIIWTSAVGASQSPEWIAGATTSTFTSQQGFHWCGVVGVEVWVAFQAVRPPRSTHALSRITPSGGHFLQDNGVASHPVDPSHPWGGTLKGADINKPVPRWRSPNTPSEAGFCPCTGVVLLCVILYMVASLCWFRGRGVCYHR